MDEDRAYYANCNFALNKRYKIKDFLGSGTYGTVCSVVDVTGCSSRPVAVKKVSGIFDTPVLVMRAYRELRLLHHLRGHKNIVSLVDLDFVHQRPYDGLYCYQELVEYDLARVIQSNIQLTEFHVQSLVYQLVCGVKYIHSASVIHRDLKPGNLLVNSLGQLKICDFGLARGLNKSANPANAKITRYVATRWYRAPELMIVRGCYTQAIDMWSVGCVLGELLHRQPLFRGKCHLTQLKAIMKVIGPPSLNQIVQMGGAKTWDFFKSKSNVQTTSLQAMFSRAGHDAVDMLERLLTFDVSTRLIADQALDHPFLASVRNKPDEVDCPFIFDFQFERLSIDKLLPAMVSEVDKFRAELRQMRPPPPLMPSSKLQNKPLRA